MKKIAIIGAGQLGSRHLQALSKVRDEATLYIVDPLEESLKISERRFHEVKSVNKKLVSLKEISDLPKELEFVIISTNSKERLGVLKELVAHAKVKYLLLEKFLFPKIDEYNEAASILDNISTKVYVNCARRMWKFYQQLKSNIITTLPIHLTVSGTNWNLASNAVHFLDLLFYLVDEKEATIDASLLDEEIEKNKRPGYVELTGTLTITTPKGHKLTLISKKNGQEPVIIKLNSMYQQIKIDEMNQYIIINGEEKQFPMYYQSSLTNKVYEQLQNTGRCELVEYNLGAKEHLLLLNAFKSFLGDREGDIT